jgi:hypothetical protein
VRKQKGGRGQYGQPKIRAPAEPAAAGPVALRSASKPTNRARLFPPPGGAARTSGEAAAMGGRLLLSLCAPWATCTRLNCCQVGQLRRRRPARFAVRWSASRRWPAPAQAAGCCQGRQLAAGTTRGAPAEYAALSGSARLSKAGFAPRYLPYSRHGNTRLWRGGNHSSA